MVGLKEFKAVFLSLLIVFSTLSYPVLVKAAEDDLINLAISTNHVYLGDEADITLEINGTDSEIVRTIPVDVVLIIDTSGSMALDMNGNRNVAQNQRRIRYAQQAANRFVENLANSETNNNLAIVSLAHEAQVPLPLTTMNEEGKNNAISTIDGLTPCGGTNYYLALMKAKEILEKSNPDYKDIIVFMSDGKPTTSNMITSSSGYDCPFSYKIDGITCSGGYDKSYVDFQRALDTPNNPGEKEPYCSGAVFNDDISNNKAWDLEYSLYAAAQVKQAGISLYTIGFGPNVHKGILEDMVDHDSHYFYNAPTPDDLTEIYNEISLMVSDVVASDVSVDFLLPPDVEFVDGSEYNYGSSSDDTITFTKVDDVLKWNLGFLSKGEQISLNFKLLPLREAEDPPFYLGTSSYATYLNHLDETEHQSFPIEPLYVTAPIPIITYLGLYDEQCSYEINNEIPLTENVCIKADIFDDNLIDENTESGELLDRVTFSVPSLGVNAIGKCTVDYGKSSNEQKIYSCEFKTSLPITSEGIYSFDFSATDLTDKTGVLTTDESFLTSSCDGELNFKMAGTREHSVLIKVKDALGNVLVEKTIHRKKGKPNIEKVIVPELSGNGNYFLDMIASGPYPAAGNPVKIIYNGKVSKNYIFNINTNEYLGIPIKELSPFSNDICLERNIPESEEKCDDLDNDGDGLIDENVFGIEGAICGECKIGEVSDCKSPFKGICENGKQTCEENFEGQGVWGDCYPNILPNEQTEGTTCDRLDNDCDGKVDENLDCDWFDCTPNEKRACRCDCSKAKILLVRDDNHHNEDITDIDVIRSDLTKLGLNVIFKTEEELSGKPNGNGDGSATTGFNYDDIKDYDLVWFSNPGYPPDDESSLLALKQYYEEGNPVIIQGDDMSRFNANPNLIQELTGLVNVNNGLDTDHKVIFENTVVAPFSRLMSGLAGQEFNYDGDDIDVTYISQSEGDFHVLARGYCYTSGRSCSLGSSYTPMPVITVKDNRKEGKGVVMIPLLTFSEIEPEGVRQKFTANSVQFLMNLVGNCECEEANPPVCGEAVQICQDDGTWGVCEGVPYLEDEVCDGYDNDCDCRPLNNGLGDDSNGDGIFCSEGDLNVDEGLNCDCIVGQERVCGPEVNVPGVCQQGKQICVDDGSGDDFGTWGECTGALWGVDYEIPDETCDNGIDDDCDGMVDGNGLITSDFIFPADPDCPCSDIDLDGICDLDDNCVNIPNGPLLGTCVDKDAGKVLTSTCDDTTSCTQGECVSTQIDSNENGFGDVCDCIPSEEICDGIDNDCNGAIDENGCECTLGSTQPCGQTDSVAHCVQQCVQDGSRTNWGDECINIEDEDLGNTFSMHTMETYLTCSNGLDDDCDNTADYDGTTLADGTVLPMDPDCNCENYITDYPCLYSISEDAVTSVIPSKFMTDYSFNQLKVNFKIDRNPPFPVLGMGDVEIKECRLYGQADLYKRFFESPVLTLASKDFPIETTTYSMQGNSLEINYKYPTDMLQSSDLLKISENYENKLKFECDVDISSLLGDQVCDTCTHTISFDLETATRQCEPRVCLIKEELNKPIVNGYGEVLDTILDVMNFANSLCSIIPTIGSLFKQTGVTVKTVGFVLSKIPVVSALGTVVMGVGEAIIKPGQVIMDYAWNGKYGVVIGMRWFCDFVITCEHSTKIADWMKDTILFGDTLTNGANDWLGGITSNIGFTIPDANPGELNAPGRITSGTPTPGAEIDEYLIYDTGGQNPNYDISETNKVFTNGVKPDDYDYQLGFQLSSGLSTDNLWWSIATLCARGILEGIMKYRTIQCNYVKCLTTEQPVASCVANKGQIVCEEFVGSLFELIGPLRLMQAFKSLLTSLIQNWPDILVENGYRIMCDIWAKDPTSWVTWPRLFLCQIPDAVFDSIELIDTLKSYAISLGEFSFGSWWDDTTGDTCDEMMGFKDYLNENTQDCNCYNGADEFTLETFG